MITDNQVKEQLSISYVNAVAAMCNYACELTRIDTDSIDVTIRRNGYLASASVIRSPEIQIQLKATENLVLNTSSQYPFSLSIKNYDDLRSNTMAPRLLVVLNLPAGRNNWLSHSVNDLILRNCSYWLNLHGEPTSPNSSNVTVYLPSTNVFSPTALEGLMFRASMQQPL